MGLAGGVFQNPSKNLARPRASAQWAFLRAAVGRWMARLAPRNGGFPQRLTVSSNCHKNPAHCRTALEHPVTHAGAYNVLILCTGNSARSIMAEAILNKLGAGKFRAYSAGSQPRGEVHPEAISLLTKLGYDVSSLPSKSWKEFAGPGSPHMDFIFTVCDEAAGESCPIWPGHPVSAHWGVPDPAATHLSHAEIGAIFADTYHYLHTRISVFVSLPIESLDKISLHDELHAIGGMEGATARTKERPARRDAAE
jgi:protein-tyrosine-phosphatase